MAHCHSVALQAKSCIQGKGEIYGIITFERL